MSDWITCPKCGAIMYARTDGHLCPTCGYKQKDDVIPIAWIVQWRDTNPLRSVGVWKMLYDWKMEQRKEE